MIARPLPRGHGLATRVAVSSSPAVIDSDGLHGDPAASGRDPGRPLAACGVVAGRGSGSGPLAASSTELSWTVTPERCDRGRVDRRQGRPRPRHAPAGRPLSRLRVRIPRRLHHARTARAVVRERGQCEIHRLSFEARCYAEQTSARECAYSEPRGDPLYRLRGYRVLAANARTGRNELDIAFDRGAGFGTSRVRTRPGAGGRRLRRRRGCAFDPEKLREHACGRSRS